MNFEEQIRQSLRQVIDPEIGMNVVDLGFIRKIDAQSDPIRISMVLSAPFCPLAGYLVNQVRVAAESVTEGRKVEIELLNEPWRPPWLEESEEGQGSS